MSRHEHKETERLKAIAAKMRIPADIVQENIALRQENQELRQKLTRLADAIQNLPAIICEYLAKP